MQKLGDSNNKIPLVSISCITFNHENYIRDCIEGFLIQETTFPFEVLIHDDASTDKTPEIITEYSAKHPNIIKPIFQTENQFSQGVRGIAIKFNFSRAKGKYIAMCEGDDYWTDPHKLQKQVDFLETNPDYVICYHDASVIDENGNLLEKSKLTLEYKRDFSSEELMNAAWILTLTMCFRNLPILKNYPPEASNVINSDTFLTVILGQYGKGKYLGKEIQSAVYRKHLKSIWSSLEKEEQDFQNFMSLLYMFQYKLRTTSRENAVSFLFKTVYLSYSRIYPKKNPIIKLKRSFSCRLGLLLTWVPRKLLDVTNYRKKL